MTERTSRLENDIKAVVEFCKSSSIVETSDVSKESLTLVFKTSEEKHRTEYIFNFSPDYPDGTVVCHAGDAGNIETKSVPLTAVLTDMLRDWCSVHGLPAPALLPSTPVSMETFTTQVSVASSEYTDASEDLDDDFCDYTDDYLYDDSEEMIVHLQLETEISRVQDIYGPTALEHRVHAGIDEMDIFLYIDLNNFLDEHTASAWGVKLEEPLVILLHVKSASQYLDGHEPQVDVFQATPMAKAERRKAGVCCQMKKIMQTFVSDQWKALSNSTVEEHLALPQRKTTVVSKQEPVGSTEPGFNRQQSIGAQMALPGNDDDLQADKKIPPLDNGFLSQCIQYALNRVRTLNEFCVICDDTHVVESGLIKPCVCTRELCVFAFQTLGVMADAAEAIATDADVVDVLIAMANAAANSPRANLILDPYPSIVDPSNPNKLALDPKIKDFNVVKTVIKEVIAYREDLLVQSSLRSLQTRGRSPLKQELDHRNRLAFSLMQWIIATCRAHIVLLPESRQLKSMKTKYQFLLISSPPAKEALFHQHKAKHGSTFAFHGSNVENWHSILRKGLINASGTKYQLHGAAYGGGIYLSPCSSVSFGYTGYSMAGKKISATDSDSLAGKPGLRCLALCEVVTSKDLKKSGDIWVCPNSDHVCTRFFFVYDCDNIAAQNLDTRSGDFKREINHAVAHIQAFRSKR